MNTQIFLIPKPPSSGMKIKNFIAYLVKEFLRENEFNINRVIVMDLFDSLFQEDPFNIQMPNDKLQLVHENIYNKDNSGTKDFIKSTIEDFTFDNRTGAIETINAGYCGGQVHMVIGYYSQLLTLLTFDSGDDKGATNILYVAGDFERKGVHICEDDYNGKVRHLYFYKPEEPFPYVSGHLNKSIKASVLHMYYRGDHKFILSVLRVCPRISSNMKDYLTKFTENIDVYERELSKEKH